MKNVNRVVLVMLATALASVASGFQEIPKESIAALGRTKGKPFSSGMVFVNGKYIDRPYIVERLGTGIRINGIQVSGQVIDWNEFLKTQAGVKVTKKTEMPAAAPAPEPAAETPPPPPPPPPKEEVAVEDDGDDTSLDDLFEDDPKPKKKPAKAPPKPAPFVRKVVPPKPREIITYSIEGDFVANDSTKAMVRQINEARTEIDRVLRSGGFICFGDRYARVVGDARTTTKMFNVLPDSLKRADSPSSLAASARAAGLVYLNEMIFEDMFQNRVDYRKLQERRDKLNREKEWKNVLNEVSAPLF